MLITPYQDNSASLSHPFLTIQVKAHYFNQTAQGRNVNPPFYRFRSPLICVRHILKYSLRIWNNRGKEHGLEKIAHYVELAWTMSDGEVIQNEVIGEHQTGE